MLLCAFILYLATLDTGFQPEELRGGDLITHQYAQVQARPSNAPGYPIYTMGGWLWFHGWRGVIRLFEMVPGLDTPTNPIPILSSYSLLWAMIALWFFYKIIAILQRQMLLGMAQSDDSEQDATPWLPAQLPAGSLPWLLSAFYAVTYFFWFYATTTEQYTSAIAQTLAIVYAYLKFQQAAERGEEAKSVRILILLALLCGLSLAHMLTVAFIVPPLVGVILWQAPWVLGSGRAVLGSVAAAFLPLVSYLYVYIRGGSHPEWWGEGNWSTPNEWFWSFVSTAQGRDELARGFEAWCGPFAGGFPAGMWNELSLPILVLGLVGTAFLGKRLATLLYGTLIIYLIFCWMYRCGNWFQVILPVYPLLLLGLVPMIAQYRGWLARRSRGYMNRMQWLPYALLIVAIVWRAGASWPQANSRNRSEDSALPSVAHLIDESLPLGSALYATLDNALALQYLNQVWGIRPDLEIVDHKEARRRIDNGQFVLATYESTPQLLTEMREETTIGLWGVSADWVALQDATVVDEDSYGDPAVLLNQTIEEGVELVGYTVAPRPVDVLGLSAEPAALDLTLYWRLASASWPDGLSISVRPTADGSFLPLAGIDPTAPSEAIIQQDQDRPMRGLEPISQIPPGQPFGDQYRLPLPSSDAANGILLILYRASEGGFTNMAEVWLETP